MYCNFDAHKFMSEYFRLTSQVIYNNRIIGEKLHASAFYPNVIRSKYVIPDMETRNEIQQFHFK